MSGNKKQLGAWLHRNGVSFRVWAPFADKVSVTISGKCAFNEWEETPMQPEGNGYWLTHIKGVQAGQEYKFVITNGKDTFQKNDPRAMHLTITAGNSVITDNNFDWGEEEFVPPPVEKQVLYELHIGTFNKPDAASPGTFRDSIEKLDHLKELGVNMIEVMPINSMIMDKGWGYGIDYIFAVESLYGGRYGFKQFVKAAHAHGIGVILDVVFNHWGPDSHLDLWQFDGWHEGEGGGIYFFNDWRGVTPWGARPDYGRPEVQDYILDSIKSWMQDCRIDGLRVDSTIYMRNGKGDKGDQSTDIPEGWTMLQKINEVAKKVNPRSFIIGEDMAANEYITRPVNEGGAGFDSQWETGFPYGLREALSSSNPDKIDLAKLCVELGKNYNNNALQKVIYVDSHDTAANGSSRFIEVISGGNGDSLFARNKSILAAAIMMTAPGIPMFFQGQEMMQRGAFNDIDGINWANQELNKGVLLANKHLVSLRKNEANLTAGLTGKNINIFHIDEDNKVITYHRWNEGGAGDDVVVVINFGDREHVKYELGFPLNGSWHVRFNSTRQAYGSDFKEVQVPDVEVVNGSASMLIPPSSVIIMSQNT